MRKLQINWSFFSLNFRHICGTIEAIYFNDWFVLWRWLTAKNWLVHRKRRVELASKQTWKKYWVCLRGNVLLFYTCEKCSSSSPEVVVNEKTPPQHKLGNVQAD